jgi:hypothetical protein
VSASASCAIEAFARASSTLAVARTASASMSGASISASSAPASTRSPMSTRLRFR